MAENVIPEADRRKKETGLTQQILETLVGKQSRKVAFGVWGFIADNAFLATGKITEKTWWYVFLTCALLVGFGTILDELLRHLGDQFVGAAATKIRTVIASKTNAAGEETKVAVSETQP